MESKIIFVNRIEELEGLGLKFSPYYGSYIKDDINIHWSEMTIMDDSQWSKLISEIKNRVPKDYIDPYAVSQIS